MLGTVFSRAVKFAGLEAVRNQQNKSVTTLCGHKYVDTVARRKEEAVTSIPMFFTLLPFYFLYLATM